MNRFLAFWTMACLFWMAGCAALPAVAPVSDSGQALVETGTVSGVITAVNGNEITLELVQLQQAAMGMEDRTEESAGAGDAARDDRFAEPEQGGTPDRSAPGQRADQAPPGAQPQGAGTMAQRGGYTRTGETAVYQIPVGVPVYTVAGAEKDFNSLAADYLVTVTLSRWPDGTERASAVQVIQAV